MYDMTDELSFKHASIFNEGVNSYMAAQKLILTSPVGTSVRESITGGFDTNQVCVKFDTASPPSRNGRCSFHSSLFDRSFFPNQNRDYFDSESTTFLSFFFPNQNPVITTESKNILLRHRYQQHAEEKLRQKRAAFEKPLPEHGSKQLKGSVSDKS